ncbi:MULTISPECIES: nucleoside-diphosphate sugar epimerase/dehydratase [Pseudomonadota]|uniref:polysaccharide biosynthesis protein n=1 Tax=Pseudomonadota TaxID=1224 RepID=UPI0022C89714|nr:MULTISPECIES: nucleoside-diphosphate sugar epimerase/dehydratase [Pseudomonadota]MCZ8094986.1 nucleoside-diphosphate sugar epimerase/dehydratase [Acidovorax sp.]MCZ8227659.1 nucleoside-diphosphate sugar epimerase/dehydratase [Burkholderiaceae bacterium]MCZ8017160.1 nucleoside-diphosphate sugar epimerase/dehydratase [Limnobacter sp.]MCZ8233285.1 nucleoside-diphosphate sugar epimerase/dehydratase [Novosphingobium sp.]MCZ8265183.1 nucleoside-diphosphate sugar epimerase/dehydratase [Novosphingo
MMKADSRASLIVNFINGLKRLNRPIKIALQVAADSAMILGSFLFVMTLRLESVDFASNFKVWLVFFTSGAAAIATFWSYGLYQTMVRFLTSKIIGAIGRGTALLALSMLALNAFVDAEIPRSVPIMTATLVIIAVGGLRFQVRQMFRRPLQMSKRPVAIYGAGETGLELLNSLFHGRDYAPIAFIDDDQRLHGLMIGGCRVYPPSELPQLKDAIELEAVLLALPNIGPVRRRQIVSQLEELRLEVKTIPSLSNIVSGKTKISQLRHVTPEELLGRDPVPPDQQLLARNITGKIVMVTGAGGSIGSELCRQVLDQNPLALVLYEISELALYSLEGELSETIKRLEATAQIIPILGSVQDEARLDAVMKAFKVQTIYHAAAYKHVPIVEENVVEGIRNNVFGTLAAATLAHANGIENFILISTDKAVRPTNVMGATKRIAELICQGLAQQDTQTVYSMVRFGNVLGSSGSVIPRFTSQIEAGGPITVTHPEVNRYFMTIPEASQLVIQAGAMAQGGDVFVLDMGMPVKIVDLAVTMVKLHGLKPYFVDHANEVDDKDGDIAIHFTGLRKGEKLYEELLIGNKPKPTAHPRVMTASEASLPFDNIMETLERLRYACAEFNLSEVRSILEKLPLDYTPTDNEIGDLTWGAVSAQRAIEKRASEV